MSGRAPARWGRTYLDFHRTGHDLSGVSIRGQLVCRGLRWDHANRSRRLGVFVIQRIDMNLPNEPRAPGQNDGLTEGNGLRRSAEFVDDRRSGRHDDYVGKGARRSRWIGDAEIHLEIADGEIVMRRILDRGVASVAESPRKGVARRLERAFDRPSEKVDSFAEQARRSAGAAARQRSEVIDLGLRRALH